VNTLLYTLLCLVWGSTWLAIKIGLQDAPPVWSAAIRMLLAGLILLLYTNLAGKSYPDGIRNKWRVAWPGLVIYGMAYALVYVGMQRISSAMSSILFAAFPFFIAILVAILVKSEKISLRALIGIIVGFAGIVVIFAGPVSLDGSSMVGAALVIASAILSAYGTVHVKAFLQDQPVIVMMALQMTLGGLLLTLAAVAFEPLARFEITAVSIGSILYLTLFGSIFAFAGYFWLLKRMPALTLSLIAFITPIVAIILGCIVLDETFSIQDYIGTVLVLGGVMLARQRQGAALNRLPRGSTRPQQ